MEKKTIGGFIAVLRKAKGLTQKQLADMLCVSDKAVSRWERDEAMPDLSLIPAIAEIFGVTCDELLRGQRIDPQTTPPERTEAIRDKQLERHAKAVKTRYETRSILSIGIAAVGLIAAMICNFAFLRAILGFWVGCVFYAAAMICHIIFTIQAQASIDDETFEGDILDQLKVQLFGTARNTTIAILVLLAASVPLLMAGDAYFGLEFGSWALYALIFSGITLLLCIFFAAFIALQLNRGGSLPLPKRTICVQRLRIRYMGIFAVTVAVIFILQAAANSILPDLLVTGTTFDTVEDFVEFMETPMNDGILYADPHSFSDVEIPVESVPTSEENMIVHEDGSVTYFDDGYTDQIFNRDGSLLLEFRNRNETVRSYSFTYDDSGTVIGATVITNQDMREVQVILTDLVNPIFMLAYIGAAIIIVFLYRRKVSQITQ